MADLMTIRQAIKTTVESNLSGIKVYPHLPEIALVLPALLVEPNDSDFVIAMGRGTDQHSFSLLMLVSYNELETAQHNLDPYVSGSGDRSIRQVIWNNRTLGHEGWHAHISSMFDYGIRFKGEYQGRGHEQIGARLGLTVYTSGSS